MPLPLPNLDTRRWDDLVAEGRAQIPVQAPSWTDHNASDPGITLVDLFAWMVEGSIYRCNRVLPRHRHAFLRLLGVPPQPPQPARVMLDVALRAGQAALHLPKGLQWAAAAGPRELPFRQLAPLTACPAAIAAVQTAPHGGNFEDQTRTWRSGAPFLPWGAAPAMPPDGGAGQQAALYIGFDAPLPAGTPLSLGLAFGGGHADARERQRILEEATAATGGPGGGAALPPHHAIRTAWDWFDGSRWQPLEGDAARDGTRGFTLDGLVVLRLPQPSVAVALGVVPTPLHYLRCRLAGGPPDQAPAIAVLAFNAVMAEQVCALQGRFPLRGAVPPTHQQIGTRGPMALRLDDTGAITALRPGNPGLTARVLAHEPAAASRDAALVLDVVLLGRGNGLPGQSFTLPQAPLVEASVQVWSLEGQKVRTWTRRPDLAASSRTDLHFTLDAMSGRIAFGDGEHGAVPPREAALLAAGDATAAGEGNVAAASAWRLWPAPAGLAWNAALLGQPVDKPAQALGAVRNRRTAAGGSNAQDIESAAGRAAEALWAHERLLGLPPADAPATLDGLAREAVLAVAAPARAATLLDHERLALDVPGAPVARARAWAGIEPLLPGVHAPGVVTVVVLPWLPAGQPQPSAALLAAVRRFLERRRLVGTQLRVVGPQYRLVTVRASLVLQPGTRPQRVLDEVQAALRRFLDPLQGGPDGRGWPFGRDVPRTEILEVMDRTAGVDHVASLELQADGGAPQCGNVCLGPLQLVASGGHDITVQPT